MTGRRQAVGRSGPRRDALDKVLGRARFAADVKTPGALHLALARSTVPHARLRAVGVERALAVPGVIRVFTASDVPGENRYGIIGVTRDQPMLADGVVRFAGEAVALVAAETPEAARAGARAVEIEYEGLPVVFDPIEALGEDAYPIHEKGNLCFEQNLGLGNVDGAFAAAAVVVEHTYRTSSVEHAYIEPEAGFASLQDGVLVVTVSTQNPHYDRDDLCRLLGLSHDRVRVVQATTGGGFGGKLDLSVQPYVALATWHTGRPSRLVYTREESFLATAKRHPFVMRYRTAADAEGRLVAVEADLVADTGAYASYALAVAMRAAVNAVGPYLVPNARIRSRAVYTNRPFSGAMRGFGAPQTAFAHEGQMDRIAAALGLDPLHVRRLNALRPGDTTVTGQVLEHSVGIVECLDRVDELRRRWQNEPTADGDSLRGIGVGAMFYGIGNTGVSNPSTAQVEIDAGGRVTLFTGCAEIGQGSDQTLSAICAEALGVDVDDIRLVRGDTGRTTNAGATSASRQTYISGGAVYRAAVDACGQLLAAAEPLLEIPAHDLELADGVVRCRSLPSRSIRMEEIAASLADRGERIRGEGRFDPDTSVLDHGTGQGRPYGTYAFAAQVAQVAVDPATAQVRVERLAAAHDVGRAIYPVGVLGQIAGGATMGLGMALMEAFTPGSDRNLDTYLIPTALDVPEMTALYVESPEPSGPYGAKGVGEPALIPTAPAIVSAIAAAVGHRVDHLPANLERVLEALRKRGSNP